MTPDPRHRLDLPGMRLVAGRFGLGDAMILVAATAVGLAATRALVVQGGWHNLTMQLGPARVMVLGGPPWAEWTAEAIHLNGAILAMLATPTAVAWTLAVLALGLRAPRPGRRKLARRPGLVAGLAILPTLVAWGAFALGVWLVRGSFVDKVPMVMAAPMGLSVLAAWLPLILGRRWRPEPTWTDRLGRLLGIYWIASGLILLGLFSIWGL
jgi:hypothetical protein